MIHPRDEATSNLGQQLAVESTNVTRYIVMKLLQTKSTYASTIPLRAGSPVQFPDYTHRPGQTPDLITDHQSLLLLTIDLVLVIQELHGSLYIPTKPGNKAQPSSTALGSPFETIGQTAPASKNS